MAKKSLLMFVAIGVIALFLGTFGAARSYAGEFTDDFNDGNADGWWLGYSQHTPWKLGDWVVEDEGAPNYGVLSQYESGDHFISLVENIESGDQTVSTDVRLNGFGSYGGVTMWFQDDDNYINILIYPAAGFIDVFEMGNGVASVSYYYDSYYRDVWYNLEVVADSDSGELEVYVDGDYLFTHTADVAVRSGQSGVNMGNSDTSFDNFSLSSPDIKDPDFKIHYLPIGDFASAKVEEINDKGVMVGYGVESDGSKHAVKWVEGQIYRLQSVTDLYPGQSYDQSTAVDINDKGEILGRTKKGSTDVNVIWDKKGIHEVVADRGLVCLSNGVGSWITNKGEIVGTCTTEASNPTGEGFIIKNGVRRSIGTLFGKMSIVEDVSNKGHITGFSNYEGGSGVHPFLYYKGDMIDLMAGLETSGFPKDVNEKGEVVGYSTETGFYSGFLYNNKGLQMIKNITSHQYVFNLSYLVDTKGRVFGTEQEVVPYSQSETYLYDKGEFYDVIFEDGWLPEEVNKKGVFIGNVDGKPAYWTEIK